MPTHPAILRLTDRVLEARSKRITLDIRGGNTKAFYGELPAGEPLDLGDLSGIASYEPSELVVTALAATPVADLEAALAERGQCLPFEPPRFTSGGTVGGMVAAGLSGPARAAAGPLRDYVLGVTLLNGRGELLTFGGQVMKNVAGYDVSRLMAGSWGVLGILCDISLKVAASRADTATLAFAWDERRALEELARWNALPLSLSASAWHDGCLRLRISGAAAAVRSTCHKLGGVKLDPAAAAAFWVSVRDHRHEFFHLSDADLAAGECLWRLSLPASTPPLAHSGREFIEWGGVQRWWRSRSGAPEVRRIAAAAGGHATLVRAADKSAGAFTPLRDVSMRIHRALKSAFDPDHVFNPGRLYAGL